MSIDVTKAWWLMGDSAIPGNGIWQSLLTQNGNRGTGLKARVIFNGVTTGGKYQGSYSPVATYSQYDIIGYPNDPSPLRYRANQSTSAGQNPDTHPAKWDLTVGVEFLQDLGLGAYARYSLGVRNDSMIRQNGLEIGTYATSSFTRYLSNLNGKGAASSTTSVTSMTIPTSHPTSRSLTVGTGLTIPDSTTIGTASHSFAMPTSVTALAVNLPSGLALVLGDVVTLYGDANNFFTYVIARYNNTTGVAYGASSSHIGSGTFATWTVKTERMIYINRTADPTGKNLFAMVQSYNSGTGLLTFNTMSNTGSTTNSDWTVTLSAAKQPLNPTAGAGTNFNQSDGGAMGHLGCFMDGTFVGDRLVHISNIDNRGTGWLYIYGNGANDAAIPNNVEIDTYNASLLTVQSLLSFNGLIKGTHNFIAVSKVSANGSSANTRAWINSSTTAANMGFANQYEYDVFTPTVTPGPTGAESFGEIAYNFRDTDGGDTGRWLPEHSNVLTTYATSKSLTIDGSAVGLTSENDLFMLKFIDISTATLLQTLDIQHPQATGSMGSMNVNHSFDRNGLYNKIIITWAQAGVIVTGYTNMVFLGDAWFNKVLCQDLQVINRPADNTSVNLTASEENQQNYLFYSTGADPLNDYVIGLHFPNPTRDWRVGGSNRGIPFIQDFSGAANAKFYPFVYSGYSFAAAEVMTVEGRLYLGNKGNLVLN